MKAESRDRRTARSAERAGVRREGVSSTARSLAAALTVRLDGPKVTASSSGGRRFGDRGECGLLVAEERRARRGSLPRRAASEPRRGERVAPRGERVASRDERAAARRRARRGGEHVDVRCRVARRAGRVVLECVAW